MNLRELWRLYEADKRIQGFSPKTLKAYILQHINGGNNMYLGFYPSRIEYSSLLSWETEIHLLT